jgi:hypothetical protein
MSQSALPWRIKRARKRDSSKARMIDGRDERE